MSEESDRIKDLQDAADSTLRRQQGNPRIPSSGVGQPIRCHRCRRIYRAVRYPSSDCPYCHP